MVRPFPAPILLLAALAGCAAFAPEPEPPVARTDEVVLPDGGVGRDVGGPGIFEGFAEARAERSAALTFIEVVERVEPVAEAQCRDQSPTANCDFRIVVDDRPGQPPNAFQTLDREGRPIIAFTLALIADVRNADELAFVLAHEAAHHVAGHLERQRQNAVVGAAVFGQLAGAVGGASAEAIRQAQELGAVVGARSYSQDFELEADALGTIIAHRSGYDPLLGSQFFFRIPDPGNRFLGTHPPNAARVAVVNETAAALGLSARVASAE